MKLQFDANRPYALALEGGGARGAYQIGAWKALEEAGIPLAPTREVLDEIRSAIEAAVDAKAAVINAAAIAADIIFLNFFILSFLPTY